MSVDVQVECTIERPVAVVAAFARTSNGPFPMETTYTWEPAGEGATRMALRNRGYPSGFSRVAAPMMERAMRRATTKDLARLKTMLEATGGSS